MDLIYLCGCNPNETSSINGELPKTWLDQTNDEIRRFVLVACKDVLTNHRSTRQLRSVVFLPGKCWKQLNQRTSRTSSTQLTSRTFLKIAMLQLL